MAQETSGNEEPAQAEQTNCLGDPNVADQNDLDQLLLKKYPDGFRSDSKAEPRLAIVTPAVIASNRTLSVDFFDQKGTLIRSAIPSKRDIYLDDKLWVLELDPKATKMSLELGELSSGKRDISPNKSIVLKGIEPSIGKEAGQVAAQLKVDKTEPKIEVKTGSLGWVQVGSYDRKHDILEFKFVQALSDRTGSPPKNGAS